MTHVDLKTIRVVAVAV